MRADRDHDKDEQIGEQRNRGCQLEHPSVGSRRNDRLLLGELHAVGNELSPAVKPTGVHRAEPRLHVRHRLVLDLTDDQGSGQEHQQRADELGRDLERGHSGPQTAGSGTPGGSIRLRPGAPVSWSLSPGSFAPGQALATRDASTKSLRSGCPSKPSGSSSGTRLGWPSKTTPNISKVSRSCQLAPDQTSLSDGRDPPSRGTCVRNRRWCRCVTDHRCATTARPCSPASYAESQSKKPQPSSVASRTARAASCHRGAGTSTVSWPKLTCAAAPSTTATTRSPSWSGDIGPRGSRRGRSDKRCLQRLGANTADVP